jgi:hypothetical protein
MSKMVISYKLTEDGNIPDYVEDGGFFAKDANDTFNMVCIGISKDGADISQSLEVFHTKEDAEAYIKTYMSDGVITNPFGPVKNFVISDEVSLLFDKIA